MSRSSAAAFEHAATNDSSTDDGSASTAQPTWAEDKNPTRRLPAFRLEARRLDEAAAVAAMRDDEPTLDAPAPSSPEAIAAMSAPYPARVTAGRPPPLKMLVITRPARVSRSTPAVTREAERRRSGATSTIRLPKRDIQTYLVAGIWAMALSLIVVLIVMAMVA